MCIRQDRRSSSDTLSTLLATPTEANWLQSSVQSILEAMLTLFASINNSVMKYNNESRQARARCEYCITIRSAHQSSKKAHRYAAPRACEP